MTRLTDAFSFAAQCHDGMLRKGTNLPYIVHPAEVAAIAASLTDDEDVLCAAVLHDVMEDCGISLEALAARFGARVAQLVESETQMHSGDPRATWDMRKARAVKRLENGSRETKVIALADKLSNMRAIRRDYERYGDGLFMRFHQHDMHRHAWYYRSILALLEGDMGETDAWKELCAHVEYVFTEREGLAV
ncbi:MAG: bifunctional (p)ppGpp synthetase/guanosine-3',5'-bis(diphosphate) 3'-pyrophosphohydrolase [Clostridia bacterium]|nr:bifunctional (p)ppGpp synthetase/guanosine-3',5'-bis(diphosphate) 3'-pyrophosphohydrolase [Clostridia bacterium]